MSDPNFPAVWTSPPVSWQIFVLLTCPVFMISFLWLLKRNADLWAMIAIFGGTALTGILYCIFRDSFARAAALYQLTLFYLFGRSIEIALAFAVLRLIVPDRFCLWLGGKLKWKISK